MGVGVSVVGIIVTVILALAVRGGEGATGNISAPLPGALPTQVFEAPEETREPTDGTETGSSDNSNDNDTGQSPSTLYVKDLPDEAFIQEPYRATIGVASVGGTVYPSSYFFPFQNCSQCTDQIEFNIPSGYRVFEGTFGLTDESRHDDVIDGVVYFAVYSATGELLLSPQYVEYPAQVPFSVTISGTNRIRVEISQGTNYETACLCDARLVK